MATQTLVLLGDSILDNNPYTRPRPDTTAHLQRLLPDWSVQRCAMEPHDFVLQIEPSARGAEKIARAIAGMITGNGTLTSNRIFAAERDAFISRPER
jgi:hypothetical protein